MFCFAFYITVIVIIECLWVLDKTSYLTTSPWTDGDFLYRWRCSTNRCTEKTRQSYLEALAAIEPLQWPPEGERGWKLAGGWTQLLALQVQLLLLQLDRLLVAHSGEKPQVPSHDGGLFERSGPRPTSAHLRGKNGSVHFSSGACQELYTQVSCFFMLSHKMQLTKCLCVIQETLLVGCATSAKKLNIRTSACLCKSVTATVKLFLPSSTLSSVIADFSTLDNLSLLLLFTFACYWESASCHSGVRWKLQASSLMTPLPTAEENIQISE